MKKIIWQWKEMLYRSWCQTNCLNLGEIPNWTLKGLISGGIPRDHSEISAFILWFWKGRMFFRKCNLHSWASQTAQWERTHLPMQRQGRCGFDPWVGKRPWERKWKPTPVFLPGEFHGQRSLVGYSLWGRKESDTTDGLTLWCVEITQTVSGFLSEEIPPRLVVH